MSHGTLLARGSEGMFPGGIFEILNSNIVSGAFYDKKGFFLMGRMCSCVPQAHSKLGGSGVMLLQEIFEILENL